MMDYAGRFIVKAGAAVPVDQVLSRDPGLETRSARATVQLWETCRRGEVMAMRALLLRGAEANATEENGRSVLWICAWHNRLEMIELLLERGAKANTADTDGDTPIMAAARNGSLEALQCLLKVPGLQIDRGNEDNQTALWHAAANGFADIVQELIECGADLDLQDVQGRSPLWIAAHNSHIQVVDALTRLLKKKRKSSRHHFRTKDRHENDGFADPELREFETQATCLHAATDPKIVKLLLERHCAALLEARDADGRTALWLAARDNNLPVVKTLLAFHADPHAAAHSGRTALEIADMYSRHEVIRAFNQALKASERIQKEEEENHR